ncbi:LacI family DNA-binding transcriptional regulator [Asticcacaulis sp. 201]|uniref:LacI family DNA-binding transcriptional regulator n=1 Tax=Asticcacaulis sp. 201 TaxID=3028787 RepID=UPI002916B5F2|nr:LacI family DNA-binding transcriptional regulator [Asticcacaulis sp. 201]MDV6331935.1 LacI family DNA-binding transcriptional regulator [Asticcacaulis sp. 201]
MTQIKVPADRVKELGGGNAVSTINDVARLAGVSIKTVSRVMNNEPNVREETRTKVKDAANLLHYRPNLLARSLAGARSFLIGLLYDNPSSSYVIDLQSGVIARCRESGYHVLSEPQDSLAPDLGRAIASLLATIRLDGVILTPPLCDMAMVLEAVEAAGVPYVRVSPYAYPGRSAQVEMDDSLAAYKMTQHLLGLGHRDIGFVRGHPEHGSSHRRYEGFLQAMNEAGLTPRSDWIKQGFNSFASGIDAAKALFETRTDLPTALFASNDEMAFGIMAYAQQIGVKIPDQVSVVGFDDTPGSTVIWPHLTTIRQPVVDLAYAAADILLSRANGDDDAPVLTRVSRLLPFELVQRDSAKSI